MDSTVRGVPFLADLPGVGAAFRRNTETNNEVELIVLVTPEFTDAMEPTEVPACGPGQTTTMPTDYELYVRGYQEVPRGCATGNCGPGNTPGTGMGGMTDSYSKASGQMAPVVNGSSARRPSTAPVNQGDLRTASRPSSTNNSLNRSVMGSSSTTPRQPGRPVSTQQPASRSPQNPSNSYFGGGVAKPSIGAKPTLIGPSGYDDLK